MLELLSQVIKIRSTGLYTNNINEMTISLNKDYNKELTKKIIEYNTLVANLYKDDDSFIYVNKSVIDLLEDIMRIVLSSLGYNVKSGQQLINGDEIANLIEDSDLDRNIKDKYYYYFKAIIELAYNVNEEAVLPKTTVISCLAYKGVFTDVRVKRIMSDLVSANILDDRDIKTISNSLAEELGVITGKEKEKDTNNQNITESEIITKFCNLAIEYIKENTAPFVWERLDGAGDFDKAMNFLKMRVEKDE